jgi:hypothetical protein
MHPHPVVPLSCLSFVIFANLLPDPAYHTNKIYIVQKLCTGVCMPSGLNAPSCHVHSDIKCLFEYTLPFTLLFEAFKAFPRGDQM